MSNDNSLRNGFHKPERNPMPFDDYTEDDLQAYARDMNRLPGTQNKVVNELVRLTLGELRKPVDNRGNHSHERHD